MAGFLKTTVSAACVVGIA